MNIKKQFGLTHLLDIFAFINEKNRAFYGDGNLVLLLIVQYAKLLKNTKLTKDLFIGDKAIFEGFEVDYENSRVFRCSIDGFAIEFHENALNPNNIVYIKIGHVVYSEPIFGVSNLSVVADLTKDNPLKLK